MSFDPLLEIAFEKLLDPVRVKNAFTLDFDKENKILGILSIVSRRQHPASTSLDERHKINTEMVRELKICFTTLMNHNRIEITKIVKDYIGNPYGEVSSYDEESSVISILREDFLMDTGDLLQEWHLRWKQIEEDGSQPEEKVDDRYLITTPIKQNIQTTDHELIMLDILKCMSSRFSVPEISDYDAHTLNVLFIEGLKHKFIEYCKENNISITEAVFTYRAIKTEDSVFPQDEYNAIIVLRNIFKITEINNIDLESEYKMRWKKIKEFLKIELDNKILTEKIEFNKKLLNAKREGIPKNKARLVISDRFITVTPIIHLEPIQ